MVGLAALITCGLHSSGGYFYWLFYMSSYFWFIFMEAFLFLTWGVVIGVLVLQLTGRDILEELGKIKVSI